MLWWFHGCSLFFWLKYKLHPEPSSFNFFFSYGMAVIFFNSSNDFNSFLKGKKLAIILHPAVWQPSNHSKQYYLSERFKKCRVYEKYQMWIIIVVIILNSLLQWMRLLYFFSDTGSENEPLRTTFNRDLFLKGKVFSSILWYNRCFFDEWLCFSGNMNKASVEFSRRPCYLEYIPK